MGFSIRAQIWFSGENHLHKNYSLLDDLEALPDAKRETSRFLTVKDRFEVFDNGYNFEADTHVYTFYFPSQGLFEDFIIDSFDLADAEGVMISHNQGAGGPETAIYVADNRETYETLRRGIAGRKLTAFFAIDGQLIGDEPFEQAFAKLGRASQRAEAALEEAMHGDPEDFATRIIEVAERHKKIVSVPLFPIAQNYDFILGIDERNTQDALSLLAASFGAGEYSYTESKSGEFVSASVSQGENYLELFSTYQDGAIPVNYKAENRTFLTASEYLKDWTTEEFVAQIHDDGLRQAAEMFGFCVVVDIPYDEMEGHLTGYVGVADGQLEPVRFAVLDDEE